MSKKLHLFPLLILLVLLTGCASRPNPHGGRYGQFNFVRLPGNTIVITGYNGYGGNVEIPSHINGFPVTHIGTKAFAEKNISSVILPDTIVSIGFMAFSANQLTSIEIPEGIKVLQGFSENLLTSIIIPEGVTEIGDAAFMMNQLRFVEIPDTVVSIGDSAFMLNYLNEVSLNDGLTEIGSRAFANNWLRSVSIPDSVENIGSQAFFGSGTIVLDFVSTYALTGGRFDMFIGEDSTQITIGSSVEFPLGDAINNGFMEYYNANCQAAGTYYYNGFNWGFY